VSTAFLLILFGDRLVESHPGYAGVEACKGCHETYYDSYMRSLHGKKIAGTPAARFGCESCHGAGAEHASKGERKGASIFGFGKKTDVGEKSTKCLACHEDRQNTANWNMSKHRSNGIGCTDCHSMHAGVGKGLKVVQPDICFDCHRDITLQSNKPLHPLVREGRTKCADLF
jgi:DmsE family decaheme c-type cytochrome